ncbi:MAG: HAMP domain-containing sensor histidine kinase [Bacteroidales bacterium]|nr:HAMP domain-containing histidine kinase [Bacteroidales bacterium]MDD5974422.1 HAMP domain-containing sensor histidine kinase [Bacteroidales bacterium]MDY5193632.1 HAMP domain-containing sensor histidine kinase [Candidatus Aphodosoma sp.]
MLNRITSNFWLFIFAIVLIVLSLIFTNTLVSELAREEQKKVELWAEATEQLANGEFSEFAFQIVKQNTNIPVIVVDSNYNLISSRNFKEPPTNIDEYYKKQIERLKQNTPIIITLDEDEKQYIYYDNSFLLKKLSIFPYVQLILITIFLALVIWVITTNKRNEQNKVWVGLSKETAHQLGTPISSLIAWNEILKQNYPEDETIEELDKDINRLTIIAERFSKIGSEPELKKENIESITKEVIEYMSHRTSTKIQYHYTSKTSYSTALLNKPLYTWVLENVCKNAIDAMNGSGKLDFLIFDSGTHIITEIKDTGKGIERQNYKKIFEPGYTTKKRGWGLGLSLAKRIIVEYHKGKIYVKNSEINGGTTIRIEIPNKPLRESK